MQVLLSNPSFHRPWEFLIPELATARIIYQLGVNPSLYNSRQFQTWFCVRPVLYLRIGSVGGAHKLRVIQICRLPSSKITTGGAQQEELVRNRILVCVCGRPPDCNWSESSCECIGVLTASSAGSIPLPYDHVIDCLCARLGKEVSESVTIAISERA